MWAAGQQHELLRGASFSPSLLGHHDGRGVCVRAGFCAGRRPPREGSAGSACVRETQPCKRKVSQRAAGGPAARMHVIGDLEFP